MQCLARLVSETEPPRGLKARRLSSEGSSDTIFLPLAEELELLSPQTLLLLIVSTFPLSLFSNPKPLNKGLHPRFVDWLEGPGQNSCLLKANTRYLEAFFSFSVALPL